jgi:hypothetical protein
MPSWLNSSCCKTKKLPFSGSADAARRRSSNVISFDGPGYWTASTPRPLSAAPAPEFAESQYSGGRSKYDRPYEEGKLLQRPQAPFDHVSVLPVEPLLRVITDAVAFADMMETKGKEVCKEWMKINSGVPAKDRMVAEKRFILHVHYFQGRRGSKEETRVEFIIGSYGPTMASRKVEALEEMTLMKLKARFLCRD